MKTLTKIKPELGIFMLDKVDIRAEKIIRYRQTHYRMTEGSIFQKGSHSKCVWTQWRSFKICETKTKRTERRKRQIHIYSKTPEHPFLNSWSTWMENRRSHRTPQHPPPGSCWCLQSRALHSKHQHTQNISQDVPYPGLCNEPWQVIKNWNYAEGVHWPQSNQTRSQWQKD